MKVQAQRVAWKLRQVLFANRRRRTAIIRTVVILCIFPILLQIFLAYIVGNRNGLAPLGLTQAKKVLLVTAHPDDECLFFAPSVLALLATYPSMQGALLVLSTGNNYGLGEIRNAELKGSCQALGIDPARCLAKDHPDLQDNPKEWWQKETIQEVVMKQVKSWNIDTIVTFDDGGVSGHINHRAISSALQHYVRTNRGAVPVFELVTTSLIRKYTFLWDLPLTTLLFLARNGATSTTIPGAGSSPGAEGLIVSTWSQYRATRAAFASHASQYTWDRNLYMILSRYVWFNTLRKVG